MGLRSPDRSRAAAWSFPTTVEAHSAPAGASNGSAEGTVGPSAGGKCTMNHSSPTGNNIWGVQWGGFSDITLPEGATPVGLYAVMYLEHTTDGISSANAQAYFGDSGTLNIWRVSPGGAIIHDDYFPYGPAQYSYYIGSDVSSVSSREIAMRLFQTESIATMNDQFICTGVAFAVTYDVPIAIGHGANCNDYSTEGIAYASKSAPGNGILIDRADLGLMHSWCRANGIGVSVCLDAQRSCKDFLDELLTVGNSAAVYSGDRLKIIPYDEVSSAGYGEIYTAPTSSGPIDDLDDKDFATDSGGKKLPVTIGRKSRASCDNVVAIEHLDRNLDYAHNVTTDPDQMAVTLYGPRKGGTLDGSDLGMNVPSGSKSLLSISNQQTAMAIASILVKRSAAGANTYKFTLKAEWMGLEAMDLVTLTDTRLGLNKQPVRLISVKENDQKQLECEAEKFIYGLNHPKIRATSIATGTLVNVNVDPGLVNDPIIFEPTTAMLEGSGPQLWFLVSGADPNYGGCVPFVSVDGGTEYSVLGASIGPAVTGVLTADFVSHADPDTTNTLSVNVSESNGDITSQSTAIADGFSDPCYVESASGYEIVCPTVATLTSAHHYDLGTYIRRAVQGTTAALHATGKRFGILGASVLKVDIPPQWVGSTIYFKFAAYNKLGGQQNSLSECTAYSHTVVGGTGDTGDFYIN